MASRLSRYLWQQHGIGKVLTVVIGLVTAALDFRIQGIQLDAQYGRLQVIEPGICAYLLVVVFLVAAIVGQGSHCLSQPGVVGGNRTAIPQCTEVFSWIKTERGSITPGPGGLLTKNRPMRLSRILQYQQLVLCRPRH